MRVVMYLFLLLAVHHSFAQTNMVRDGSPIDSVMISFESYDSLQNYTHKLDTTGCKLWRAGTTSKPYFTAGLTSSGAIMTDTLQPYDINRNEYFTLRLSKSTINVIIGFWHKYETDSAKDGCIIEYSVDTGTSWNNVMSDCNVLYSSMSFGLHTDNFYKKDDTLLTGESAFSGTSNGWLFSRMQLYNYTGVKGTALKCIGYNDIMYRFRFKSDSIPDNKAGWIIDRMQIEYDGYSSNVNQIISASLQVYPVPVTTGIVNFPQLQYADTYRIVITDITGKVMKDMPYTNLVNIATYPQGMYYYKVSNGEVTYTGKLPKQ